MYLQLHTVGDFYEPERLVCKYIAKTMPEEVSIDLSIFLMCFLQLLILSLKDAS